MSTENSAEEELRQWYALSAPHRKELEARRLLEKNDILCFIPMVTTVVTIAGHKQRRQVPAITNLVFAYTTRHHLQEVKRGIPFIQYKVNTENGRNVPITVPERQMIPFMAVSQSRSEEITYLSPDEINITKGTRVRIIGGELNDVEGIFVKVRGKRSKRLVVIIQGVIAVTAEVNPDYIQVIK